MIATLPEATPSCTRYAWQATSPSISEPVSPEVRHLYVGECRAKMLARVVLLQPWRADTPCRNGHACTRTVRRSRTLCLLRCPRTRQAFTNKGAVVYRFENQKIASVDLYFDDLRIVTEQLGATLVPPPS